MAVMYVNSQEREKFWGTLLSLSGENREADKETLAQTIKYPPQLCRYRAVTDGSLHSLRTNILRFSTADRYDDPFDTFLHIDHHALLDEFLKGFKTIESTESILNHIRQIDAHPLHDLIEAGMTPQQLQHLVSRSPMAEYFSQAALYAREIAQKSTRSICFSENTQNEALWLKYAEHHRGFALIYKHPFYAECGSSSSRTLHASLYPICYTDKAKALWKRISPKSVYVVDFDTDELVWKAISAINRNLRVSKIFFRVETGVMDEIKSKDALTSGNAFSKARSSTYDSNNRIHANSSVKYDLIGKLVGETGLTRKAVVQILTGIEKTVFEQFKFNPEEFIIKAAALINDEKATAIIQHITYNVLDERYETDIFTEPTIKGKLGANAMKAQRHLYDHIVYDSSNERDFASDLDTNTDVAVYVKLPDSFYISTPVGHYNPDWAIAFYEGTVKHIYFVAETKGSMSSMQLRLVEESKIHCAREHFKAISNGNVVYDVVDSYQALLDKVMK